MEYYYIILIGIYNIVSIGVCLLYMDNNFVSSIIIAGGAIASSIIGVIIASSKNIKTIERLDVKVDKDHSGLSKEHDGLSKEHDGILATQKEMKEKIDTNSNILCYLQGSIDSKQQQQNRIENTINNQLIEKIEQGAVATKLLLNQLAESKQEVTDVRAELKGLKEEVNQLKEENQKLKNEVMRMEEENTLLRDLASGGRISSGYGQEQLKDDFEHEL